MVADRSCRLLAPRSTGWCLAALLLAGCTYRASLSASGHDALHVLQHGPPRHGRALPQRQLVALEPRQQLQGAPTRRSGGCLAVLWVLPSGETGASPTEPLPHVPIPFPECPTRHPTRNLNRAEPQAIEHRRWVGMADDAWGCSGLGCPLPTVSTVPTVSTAHSPGAQMAATLRMACTD